MDDLLARYRPYLMMLVLFIGTLAGTIFLLRRPDASPTVTMITATPRPTATTASIIVDVRGAVNQPGVYTLPIGSRVQDALARAGDVTSNADTRALNLARRLNDGEQLYVPRQGETTPIPTASTARGVPTATRVPSKININTATVAELDTLPGIGPALAQRIVDYRTQNGDFKTIEDIKKVRGIGDALFNQIKDLITVQ
ncbi:MAG: helix-hairpin-helix domain-containing protein [Anaerolineae bacterium]|nr:helix-hairpin-helix domain-containing protein [Anaerolineae bacterium]